MATLNNIHEAALSLGYPKTSPLLPEHFTISAFIDGVENTYLLAGTPDNPNSTVVARIESAMDGTSVFYKGNELTGGTYSGTLQSGSRLDIVFLTAL